MSNYRRLHLDFETRSTIDLRKTGVYRYAEDPTTKVIMACWAIDDEPVQTWLHTDGQPTELLSLLQAEDVIVVAHNAGFERIMMRDCLKWPVPPMERWDCTAARAARQALPRSLDGASQALGLKIAKDVDGQRLMLRMCRPRSVNEDTGEVIWWEDKPRMDRLAQYCATDVEVERELDKLLRPLTDKEREIWRLTETMNDRGVLVDVDWAKQAVTLNGELLGALNEELSTLTNGRVGAVSNVLAMKEWLYEQGVKLLEVSDDSLNKKAVENLLKTDLPDDVRRVLELREEGGKSSVAKYKAMIERASFDNRVRGNLMYHGASTGRWAGAGVQLQNLPRDVVKDWELTRQSNGKTPLDLVKMIRGTIIAPKGHRFIWADYAAVEARGVAWLAGQMDLVELFASGGKVYEQMAGMIFETDPAQIGKDSVERFLGKTVVLGCGYSMGANKFRQTVHAMGQAISEELAYRAVDTYRKGFAKIPQLWRMLNEAAIEAVRNRTETSYRAIRFYSDGKWLMMMLPSGRKIFYAMPRVVLHAGPFGQSEAIEYMAVNSLTKKWGPERTFGGKLTENAVQGICRDLIADAMLSLEEAGYTTVASVHDEIICELPDGFGDKDEMLEIMCRVPTWAKGFPIAADAKEGTRYGK